MAVKLKLKAASPSPPPFSLDDFDTSPENSPRLQPSSLPSPPTAWLSARDMKMYGAAPLRSDVGIMKCKACDKPVLKSFMGEHSSNCQKIRALEKSKYDADGSGFKRKKSGDVDAEDPDTPVKKKTKATPKVTKGRAKGPVDLDRQCGVINDKNLPCQRSLTCKTHSMGAKRAVEGRSDKYDVLLLAWNRANNPNFVEPVKRETKAERMEKLAREKAERKRLAKEAAAAAAQDAPKKSDAGGKKKLGKKARAAAAAAAGATAAVSKDGAEDVENWDDIDSEAEVDSLSRSVRTARELGVIARPLAVPGDAGTWFVGRRERLRNCRDLLVNSLTPANRSGIAAGTRLA